MGMRVPYTRRCHVGTIFFFFFNLSNRVRLCAVSFDDDVLILPDAVSTPIDDSPYISLSWKLVSQLADYGVSL